MNSTQQEPAPHTRTPGGRPLSRRGWTLLGRLLQAAPEFPTKGRWEWLWFRHRDLKRRERRKLPGGAVIECDLSSYDETWIWMRPLDAPELPILRRLLHPGETFVDVGANVGVWSLVAAAAIGPSGEVIALEPNPSIHAKLARNLSRNLALARFQPLALGASDKKGSLYFQAEEFAGCSHIVKEPTASTFSIAVDRLDDLLDGKPCHAMKVDVEGHELAALQGGESLLKSRRPWLCVEFNNRINKLTRLADWDVYQYLSRLGYRCWLFEDALRRENLPPLAPDYCAADFVNLFFEWKT